ncbi:MAG: leucine-rich repeat protein, partial [Clostridia bacterium]|nr:leucine-rich repeat protein [Clostridia bacterium]
MKNKILLFVALVSLLVCAFAFTISAEEYDYFDTSLAPTRTNYQVLESDIIEFDDGFKCLVAYVFKDTNTITQSGKFAGVLDFELINELATKEYTFENVVGFDIPEGVTTLEKYAGQNTTIKWVTVPKTAVNLANAIFQYATSMEYCGFEHTEDSTLNTLPPYTFAGCTALKSFSMPDCITTIASEGSNHSYNFAGCSNLQAVYLSKNLTTLYSGGGGVRGATFDDCTAMYLVNEPFKYNTVPEKPTIYYFPKNLETISNQCVFRGCKALNDILVFDKKVTSLPNYCFFQDSPANTVVFLGDMTTVTSTSWGTTRIVFANEADVSTESITWTYKNGQTADFCFDSDSSDHLYAINVAPTCVENGYNNYQCFCKAVNEAATAVDPLGHIKGEFVTIDYENGFLQNGYIYHKCERDGCAEAESYTIKTDEAYIFPALFIANGYSVSEEGSMMQGFVVNRDAYSEYTSKVESITFGMVAAVKDSRLGTEGGALFSAPGVKTHEKVAVVDFSSREYSIIQLVVTGLAEHADTEVFCCMYYTQGDKVYYVNEQTVSETATAQSY